MGKRSKQAKEKRKRFSFFSPRDSLIYWSLGVTKEPKGKEQLEKQELPITEKNKVAVLSSVSSFSAIP